MIFDEIEIGLKKKIDLIITESMIENFANLSGDRNPLHMNENYAKSVGFKGRICHGMLLASFFSRLIGMYIPGKNSLYLSQSMQFITPCFINDKIIIEGEVISKSISTRIITLSTNIFNESKQCLIKGKAKVLVLNEYVKK